MKRKTHYVRILDGVEVYARKIDSKLSDWKADILKDITADGNELTVISLDFKRDRPSIGLCGDKYFCEAGLDYIREDAIVIYRIEAASNRLPDKIPFKFKASYVPWSQNATSKEDPVGYIFEQKNPSLKPTPLPAHTDDEVSPNSHLKKMLHTVPQERIKSWRPKKKQLLNEGEREKSFSELKTIWASFSLEKYRPVSGRRQALLCGIIKSPQSQEEFAQLLSVFSVQLFNTIASRQTIHVEKFNDLLNCVEGLPLMNSFRAKIWKELAVNLPTFEFQKELKKVVKQLSDLPSEIREWERPLLDSIVEVAEKDEDQFLQKLMYEINESGNMFQVLSGILDRIEIGHDKEPGSDRRIKELIEISTNPPEANTNSAAAGSEINQNLDDIIQKWIIQLRLPEGKYRKDQVASLKSAFNEIEIIPKNINTINEIIEIKQKLETCQDIIKKMIAIIPDIEVLQKDISEAKESYVNSEKLIGPTILSSLINARINPEDLKEIGKIAQNETILKNIPAWVWNENGNGDNEDGVGQNSNSMIERLGNPIIRRRVSNIIAKLRSANCTTHEILMGISPPEKNCDADAHLDSCLNTLIDTIELSNRFESPIRGLIFNLANKGVEENRISRYSEKMQKMVGRVDQPVIDRIIQNIISDDECEIIEDTIDDFEKAISFCELNMGSAHSCSYELLSGWISRSKLGNLAKHTPLSKHKIEINIDHCLFDHPVRKIPLLYSAFPNEEGKYGYFFAPILLSSPYKPDELNLKIEYDIQSNLHSAWPKLWQEPQPMELNLKPADWKKKENAYIHVFKAKIPIRPPKDRRTKISLNIKTLTSSNNDVIGEKTLSWETIEVAHDKIILSWPDGIQTEYVDEHPIGPQEHVDYFVNRLKSGGSFAIVAPRRFGKTTMGKYIQKKADELNLIIPEPVICTDEKLNIDGRINLVKVWYRISENLQEMLGSSLILNEGDSIPGDRSFDHIRRAAKKKKKSGILLLFDEAQLLFTSKNGAALGTRIKDKLELYWSVREPDKVPVLIGLIGLPGLLQMGPNLQGLLMPKDIRSFKESNLNKLINKFTQNRLHTTKEAREILSQKSGNLFTLKQLLAELVIHANDGVRNWVTHEDVDKVIAEMKDRLIGSQEPIIANYLRDIFNEEDNIDLWKPRPQYPCAVALAKATYEAKFDSEVISDKVLCILNEWCDNIGTGNRKKLIYTESSINEHLSKIEELGIFLKSKGFTYDILEAWLYGISFNFPADDRDKEALFRGALERIKLPEVKVKVDSGGQATVYRFTDNGISYGLRELELRNQKDRERFYESAEILKTLQQKISLREEGSEFIYNLKEIGVVDSDNANDAKGIIGAEIYQWVEGNSLADKLESLPVAMAADIGYKISKALQFLHKYDIIHRDICPRNVILEANTSNPILIDFGISKFGKFDSDTVIQSEYTAPENKSQNFKWSYPADIFSLGKTLNAIMNPNDKVRSKLEQIILNCTDENPPKRPTADMLVEALRALISTLNIESRKAENLREISRIIESDKQKGWYLKAVDKFGTRFSSIALGLHETTFDKCAEAAQLIDFILEAYPNEKLKLTAVFNRDTDTFTNILKGKRCIDFMQNLRIERTHFDNKKSQPEILRKFNYPTEAQMKSWAIEGGELTAKALELSSLPLLITRILG